MQLLSEITEETLGIEPEEDILGHSFLFRKSARAVLLNDTNEVCLQHVRRLGFYKLPGGGVDHGETEEEALRREIHEEVGCDITIEKELGITIEYRNQMDLLHISYGYLVRVSGDIVGPSYDQGEIEDGYKPVWMPLEKAIATVRERRPAEHYKGRFITERELVFLHTAARKWRIKE